MKAIRFIVIPIVALLSAACGEAEHQRQAFYYWKTVYRLSAVEREALCGTERLYLRYFDIVSVGNGYRPAATLLVRDSLPKGMSVVPVVFVVNEVMGKLPDDSIPALAGRICRRIEQTSRQAGIASTPEWQLDCDWTATTRERYFKLLRCVKAHPAMEGRRLSATLRLHQWKYRKTTGVPPTDKVCLMCYNMGRLTEAGNRNSIINIDDLQSYLAGSTAYPLSVDVALPLFSWGVCFRREKYQGLINGLQSADLQPPSYTHLTGNSYRAEADVTLRGAAVKRGDVIRLETVDADIIEDAAKTIKRHLKNPEYVLWFHLDSLLLRQIKYNERSKIADMLH